MAHGLSSIFASEPAWWAGAIVRTLLFLACAGLVMGGCQQGELPFWKEAPVKRNFRGKTDIRLRLQTLCEGSAGLWNPRLFSCVCPRGELFTAEGCWVIEGLLETVSQVAHRGLEGDRKPLEKEWSFDQHGGHWRGTADWSTLEPALQTRLLHRLRDQPETLFQGWMFPLKQEEFYFGLTFFYQKPLWHKMFPKFGPPSDALSEGRLGFLFSADLTLLEAGVGPFGSPDPGQWIQQCEKKIQSLSDLPLRNHCQRILQGVEALFGPLKSWPGDTFYENFHHFQGTCHPLCEQFQALVLQDQSTLMVSSVILPQGIPRHRSFSFSEAGFQAIVHVSPLGQLESFQVIVTQESKEKTAWFEIRKAAWDSAWRVLMPPEKILLMPEAQTKETFQQTIRTHLQATERTAWLPGENPAQHQPGVLPVLLLEEAVDLFYPPFQGSLVWDQAVFLEQKDWQWGSFSQKTIDLLAKALFQPFSQNLWFFRSLLFGRNQQGFQEDHGSQMMAMLIRNLPQVKVHLVAPSQFSYGATPEAWIHFVQQHRIRLVNYSGYVTDLSDCDLFFKKIFSALPEVLFVIASNNQGKENPHLCPSGIGSQKEFTNVLTVAGHTLDQVSLDPVSNYGLEEAKVAAPIHFPNCLEQDNKQVSCHGTSAAAAWVSQRATRFMLQHPEKTASEVAQIFQSNCVQKSWKVQCGGPLDLSWMP